MALNNSGTISIGGTVVGQSIELELGMSGTVLASLNDSALRTLAAVPSGTIAMNNFYGKSNAPVVPTQPAGSVSSTFSNVMGTTTDYLLRIHLFKNSTTNVVGMGLYYTGFSLAAVSPTGSVGTGTIFKLANSTVYQIRNLTQTGSTFTTLVQGDVYSYIVNTTMSTLNWVRQFKNCIYSNGAYTQAYKKLAKNGVDNSCYTSFSYAGDYPAYLKVSSIGVTEQRKFQHAGLDVTGGGLYGLLDCWSATGDVYYVGLLNSSTLAQGMTVVSINSAGTVNWARQISMGGSVSMPNQIDIAVEQSTGYVAIAFTYSNLAYTQAHAAVITLDNTGSFVWARDLYYGINNNQNPSVRLEWNGSSQLLVYGSLSQMLYAILWKFKMASGSLISSSAIQVGTYGAAAESISMCSDGGSTISFACLGMGQGSNTYQSVNVMFNMNQDMSTTYSSADPYFNVAPNASNFNSQGWPQPITPSISPVATLTTVSGTFTTVTNIGPVVTVGSLPPTASVFII